MSRTKGAEGEREVVRLAHSYSLNAERTAPMQAGNLGHGDVLLTDFPNLHVEVKRTERLPVDAMVRQATLDAGTRVPLVTWRRNRGAWQATVPLCWLLNLLRQVRET